MRGASQHMCSGAWSRHAWHTEVSLLVLVLTVVVSSNRQCIYLQLIKVLGRSYSSAALHQSWISSFCADLCHTHIVCSPSVHPSFTYLHFNLSWAVNPPQLHGAALKYMMHRSHCEPCNRTRKRQQ